MSKTEHQPDYSYIKEKFNARQMVYDAYYFYTGNKSIPEDRIYVTLCNNQPNTVGSEINQVVNLGLIKKHQFFGIDNDHFWIAKNSWTHPYARWFYGEFSNIIKQLSDGGIFNPAIIYYDSTHTVSSEIGLSRLANIMNLCEKGGVLVAANVMLTDAYSKRHERGFFPENFIIDNIWNELWPSEIDLWRSYDLDTNEIYVYKSNKALMATHIFFKEEKK